jgi:peptidoglycan-N-acetylglucosamine deacetylase
VSIGKGHTPHDVALTFDDGPWPQDTGAIVAILRRYHVPATFFEVGYLAERYPGIVRKVARAGFPIGNHSYDHPVDPALAALPEPKITQELAKTNDALAALDVHPTLFRPPGGSYDDFVMQEARRLGMRVVMWSVDPQDWRSGITAKQVTRSVLKHVEAGSIVLLHDGGGDAAHTIKALPKIIRGIRHKGLGFTVVPP